MCFDKKRFQLPKEAKKDIYVLKFTYTNHAIEWSFHAYFQRFVYEVNILYKKSIWDVLRSIFKKELTFEVYHSHSIRASKRIVNQYPTNPPEWYKTCKGVFKIPKGTLYYENMRREELAAFKIEYIGPLTYENRNLIINQ